MRFSQLVVCESDGRLAGALESTAKANRWLLRRPRGVEGCVRFLQRSTRAVVTIKIGRDVVRELSLLERIGWLFPEVPIVAVTDGDDPALIGLTWDLGASYVASGRWSTQELCAVISGLIDGNSATG